VPKGKKPIDDAIAHIKASYDARLEGNALHWSHETGQAGPYRYGGYARRYDHPSEPKPRHSTSPVTLPKLKWMDRA
jgi:hypothetical protein